MANQIPVKAIYSGSDVTSLGEFTASDDITITYLPTGTSSSTVALGDHTHAYLPLAGGTMTGDLVMGANLVDGIDISARDAVLTSTATTASAALPKSGGAMTGNITTNGLIDTVDIATRDGVLTTTTATADAALPKAGGTMTGTLTVNAAAVFNDSGADVDFRVESDTDANAFFVQGQYGFIGLGQGTPWKMLHITEASSDCVIILDSNNSVADKQICFANHYGTGGETGGNYWGLGVDDSENELVIAFDANSQASPAGDRLVTFTSTGKVAIGTSTATAMLTVEGNAVAKTNTAGSQSGTVDLDFAANQNFVLTLTGNVTSLTASNEVVGQSGFIAFIQDGTGSRTVALHGDYETAAAAGLTLTATASATDLVPYLVVASSRILLGTPQLAFA